MKKQSVDAAEQSDERTTYAAAQPAEHFLRITEAKENAKVAPKKLVDRKWQVTESSKAAEDALR